jgi:hypothetical protein
MRLKSRERVKLEVTLVRRLREESRRKTSRTDCNGHRSKEKAADRDDGRSKRFKEASGSGLRERERERERED